MIKINEEETLLHKIQFKIGKILFLMIEMHLVLRTIVST